MSRFWKAAIAVLIVTLLLGVSVYAYETIWSGKGRITIEAPTGEGALEILGVSTSDSGPPVYGGTYGDWDEDTRTWTVSLPRGSRASLGVSLRNNGGNVVNIQKCVGDTCFTGANSIDIATGVTLTVSGINSIPAGEGGTAQFEVHVGLDAPTGTLPDVDLRIKLG